MHVNTMWLRFYADGGKDMMRFLARAEAEAKRAKEATERADNAEAELNKLRALLKEKGISL